MTLKKGDGKIAAGAHKWSGCPHLDLRVASSSIMLLRFLLGVGGFTHRTTFLA